MCGIIASSSLDFIHQVSPEVMTRGDPGRTTITSVESNNGYYKFCVSRYNPDFSAAGDYFIFHTQAPTSPGSTRHPTIARKGNLLWHNGIIKEDFIKSSRRLVL